MKFWCLLIFVPVTSWARSPDLSANLCEHYRVREVYFSQDCKAANGRPCSLNASLGRGLTKEFKYSELPASGLSTFSLSGSCRGIDLRSETEEALTLPTGCTVQLNVLLGSTVVMDMRSGIVGDRRSEPVQLRCECAKQTCKALAETPAAKKPDIADPATTQREQ